MAKQTVPIVKKEILKQTFRVESTVPSQPLGHLHSYIHPSYSLNNCMPGSLGQLGREDYVGNKGRVVALGRHFQYLSHSRPFPTSGLSIEIQL